MDRAIGGKFKMGRKIGSGSFGELYLGVNVHSGEEVAIKLATGRAGPSGEKAEKPPVGQEIRDELSGSVEVFTRRNASGVGVHGDHSKLKAPEDGPPKDLHDSERDHTATSRHGSASKRVMVSSSGRPSSSGEPNDSRISRLVSSSGRLSTSQRIQAESEPRLSSLSRPSSSRGIRDSQIRSFERLTISSDKRK
ncbi:hypothetical protein SAY86_030807 [Trapa natans]|uniref:Casein kinase I n=1 Tax=Trapa natans TaxID=22666 RepID=A0AAN7RHF8_TRANT|nr:hypothetical protein SAY86_030807 [Trapa natans]